MNPLEFIGPALEIVFSAQNLLLIFIGLLIGVVVGTIPGLTVTMGVILLLPFTYGLDSAASAIILLMAVYCGGVYGGSISAILLNMPGGVSSIATTFDGYPRAQKGEAYKALNVALFSSVFGGIFSSIVLLLLTSFIAQFVGRFASPEYFALGILGIALVAGVSGNSLPKAIIGALIGIFIANIGLDVVTGVPRFTFGSRTLQHGVSLLPTMVALIALTQVVLKTQDFVVNKGALGNIVHLDKKGMTRKEAKSIIPACIRSSALASFVGAMPGVGACVAQFLCYNEVRRASKRPQDFGKGSLEGIAAAESCSNSVAGSALVPLLTLGIPGDGVTALLLGAFVLHGVQPGPAMFTTHGVTAYSIMIGKLVTAVMLILIGILFTRIVSKIVRVRYSYLVPVIVTFCFAGAFASTGHIREITIAAGILIFSYFLNVLKISVVPLMLGMILADIMERNFVTSMMAHDNNLLVFFQRPISLVILLLTVVLTWSLIRVNKKVMRIVEAETNAEAEATAEAETTAEEQSNSQTEDIAEEAKDTDPN